MATFFIVPMRVRADALLCGRLIPTTAHLFPAPYRPDPAVRMPWEERAPSPSERVTDANELVTPYYKGSSQIPRLCSLSYFAEGLPSASASYPSRLLHAGRPTPISVVVESLARARAYAIIFENFVGRCCMVAVFTALVSQFLLGYEFGVNRNVVNQLAAAQVAVGSATSLVHLFMDSATSNISPMLDTILDEVVNPEAFDPLELRGGTELGGAVGLCSLPVQPKDKSGTSTHKRQQAETAGVD
eukprot:jgi/Mesvir1/7195/Mv19023-RA.1